MAECPVYGADFKLAEDTEKGEIITYGDWGPAWR